MKWIRVADRLPDEDEIVIVYDPKYGSATGWISQDADKHISCSLTDGTFVADQNITHWMPMPGKPED